MKLAIPNWEGRVSSVFDFARQAVIVELSDAKELARSEVALSGQGPARVTKLRQMGVDTLICGAISRVSASWASACGIRLFSYVTGSIDEVIEAFKNEQLGSERFVLPGRWPGVKRPLRHRAGCHGRRYGHRGMTR
jgi:predicted Fe-Mo cluster-binding NifX family protein